jgi:hypothetical protein
VQACVDNGEAVVGFTVARVSTRMIMKIADADKILPPKVSLQSGSHKISLFLFFIVGHILRSQANAWTVAQTETLNAFSTVFTQFTFLYRIHSNIASNLLPHNGTACQTNVTFEDGFLVNDKIWQ